VPRPCTVCASVNAVKANKMLLAGKTRASIARELGYSPDSVERHARHLMLATRAKEQPTVAGESWRERFENLYQVALQQGDVTSAMRVASAAQRAESAASLQNARTIETGDSDTDLRLWAEQNATQLRRYFDECILPSPRGNTPAPTGEKGTHANTDSTN
jgi:hypothetical protein